MPIDIRTIGLRDSMRSVVSSVKSSMLYILDAIPAGEFSSDSEQYELLFSVPVFGVKDDKNASMAYTRGNQGSDVTYIMRATAATPPYPMRFEEGQHAVLDFSGGTKVYQGKVVRVVPKLSSLWRVYIDTSVSREIEPHRAGIIIGRGGNGV